MTNVIQTARLTLVQLTGDHVDAFHTVWSNPEATKWSLHGTNTTIEASREWMTGVIRSPEHDARRSWLVYVTGAQEPSQCIGIITLRPSNDSAKESSIPEDRWQLGYLFRPQYWGQGYATESCLTAIDSLKNDLEGSSDQGRAILVAYIDPGNDESMKVLKKLAFEVVGHKKLDGPDRFLAGQWRAAENLILKRDLTHGRFAELYAAVHQLGLPSAPLRSAANPQEA